MRTCSPPILKESRGMPPCPAPPPPLLHCVLTRVCLFVCDERRTLLHTLTKIAQRHRSFQLRTKRGRATRKCCKFRWSVSFDHVRHRLVYPPPTFCSDRRLQLCYTHNCHVATPPPLPAWFQQVPRSESISQTLLSVSPRQQAPPSLQSRWRCLLKV